MKKISDYSALIEKELRGLTLPKETLANLYEPIVYALSSRGKRLRPALLMMAAEAFGGTEEESVYPALGIEMFHNFTLLHDDVMDNSVLRRGRKSVYAKWDINTAILSGDTMLTLATELISRVTDYKLRIVLDTFNSMAIKVYEGQQRDMDFEKRDNVSTEEYISMIKEKTGALLGCSAKIGAIIGGAGMSDAEKMYEFGMQLGVAFQIQDDYLDVFGDSTTFGKPIGGDINNNKKTYLLLRGLAKGGPEGEALSEALGLAAGDTKVKTVTRLYEKMNLSEECRKEIEHYSSEAVSRIRETSLDNEWKDSFRHIVEKLTGRRK